MCKRNMKIFGNFSVAIRQRTICGLDLRVAKKQRSRQGLPEQRPVIPMIRTAAIRQRKRMLAQIGFPIALARNCIEIPHHDSRKDCACHRHRRIGPAG